MAFIQPTGLTRGTHQFATKLQNRFLFSIDNDPTVKLTCKSAQRPSINFNEVRIPHINKVRYEAGIAEYDPINITLMDYVVPSTSQYVMEWLSMHCEIFSGRSGYPSFYRRQATLEVLGATNDVVEKWDYYNCWISSANLGDLSWDNDQPVEIMLTLRFDDVVQAF